jgi:hypothetical protein
MHMYKKEFSWKFQETCKLVRNTHRHSIPAYMLAEALRISLFHHLQGIQWELLGQGKEWWDDQEPARVLLQPHVLEGAGLHAALPLHVSGLKFRCSFVVFICVFVSNGARFCNPTDCIRLGCTRQCHFYRYQHLEVQTMLSLILQKSWLCISTPDFFVRVGCCCN